MPRGLQLQGSGRDQPQAPFAVTPLREVLAR